MKDGVKWTSLDIYIPPKSRKLDTFHMGPKLSHRAIVGTAIPCPIQLDHALFSDRKYFTSWLQIALRIFDQIPHLVS